MIDAKSHSRRNFTFACRPRFEFFLKPFKIETFHSLRNIYKKLQQNSVHFALLCSRNEEENNFSIASNFPVSAAISSLFVSLNLKTFFFLRRLVCAF